MEICLHMQQFNKLVMSFWIAIFGLLVIPISNSFYINLKRLINTMLTNKQYTLLLSELENENDCLNSKVKYYKSLQGIKMLIKERLSKVEKDELLIKFQDQNKVIE